MIVEMQVTSWQIDKRENTDGYEVTLWSQDELERPFMAKQFDVKTLDAALRAVGEK